MRNLKNEEIKIEELKNVSGGEGPQYIGGGPNEECRKIMEKTRKTFEDQKAYFSKSYDGLYDNVEDRYHCRPPGCVKRRLFY